MSGTAERVPVSIVCVYNDPQVLESCLSRSVQAGSAVAPQTELLPVDNRAGEFATAGAALNHGARLAHNDVVVFAHQDVFLHSLEDLERAAGQLVADPRIGILGAVGVDRRRRAVGATRDRVVPIGRSVAEPEDVETLDEVLFLLRREDVLREPLSEDDRLAWHAYAVEYCLRVRRDGRRATAVDIPLTHNSLTTNLARLDVAHRTVGDAYPELRPIQTTCGVVRGPLGERRPVRLARRSHGVATWWRESVEAAAVARACGAPQEVVLADIRLVVDDAARLGGLGSVRVVEVRDADGVDTSVDGLHRFGRAFSAASLPWPAVAGEVAARPETELLLCVNLTPRQVGALLPGLAGVPHVVGLARDTGLWVMAGVAPDLLAPLWPRRRNRPIGSARAFAPAAAARPLPVS